MSNTTRKPARAAQRKRGAQPAKRRRHMLKRLSALPFNEQLAIGLVIWATGFLLFAGLISVAAASGS